MPSFDVVSEVDLQEVDNAVNQARKELNNRYDFRGSKSEIQLDKSNIKLVADDDMKLKALTEILKQKMVKRGVGVRTLEFNATEKTSNGMLKQAILIKQGISIDECRNIVKLIKDQKLKKVQAQIQQNQVRVSAPKKDDLQAIMGLLKEKVTLELQFVNFKDS